MKSVGQRVCGGVEGPGDHLSHLILVTEDGRLGSVVLLASVQTLHSVNGHRV